MGCDDYGGEFAYLVGLGLPWDSYGLVSLVFMSKPYSGAASCIFLTIVVACAVGVYCYFFVPCVGPIC